MFTPNYTLINLHPNPDPDQVLTSAFTTGYPYCENKGWFAFNENGRVRSLLALALALTPKPEPDRALLHP